MDRLARVFAKNEGLFLTPTGEGLLVVPLVEDVADMSKVFSLNGTAQFLWESLDGRRDGHALSELLHQEFQVGLEQARADVSDFLASIENVLAHARP